ncbi:hypothetical protein JVT61DRAFT_14281 [Boletus reticuloceps]|uniref:Uncharacterized protein n=1 Tax=Boletus reticuloceps TaxID=495285 RepID=A0A8I2YCS1_9AGAM|nr:hypothetical protein JVT61DRAFT_14281 [Boletus reticuloceps]
MASGFIMVALEYPLPFVKGSPIHRSMPLRPEDCVARPAIFLRRAILLGRSSGNMLKYFRVLSTIL